MDKNLRQERLASIVQAAAAEFFAEHAYDWGINAVVLVDQVFVSPDLHNVEIWVSFTPWKADEAKRKFTALKRQIGELKKALAQRVELRRFPEVELKLSDPEKTFRIMEVLDELKKKEAGHETSSPDSQGEN